MEDYHTIEICFGHLLLGYRVRDFQDMELWVKSEAGCFLFCPGAWSQVRVRVFFPWLLSLTWSQIRVRVLFLCPFYPRLPTLNHKNCLQALDRAFSCALRHSATKSWGTLFKPTKDVNLCFYSLIFLCSFNFAYFDAETKEGWGQVEWMGHLHQFPSLSGFFF